MGNLFKRETKITKEKDKKGNKANSLQKNDSEQNEEKYEESNINKKPEKNEDIE